jgi:glutamine cyclotransferase
MRKLLALFCPILLVVAAADAFAQTPVYGYEILNRYPHDASAFTEGLVYTGGTLYESTGLYGPFQPHRKLWITTARSGRSVRAR